MRTIRKAISKMAVKCDVWSNVGGVLNDNKDALVSKVTVGELADVKGNVKGHINYLIEIFQGGSKKVDLEQFVKSDLNPTPFLEKMLSEFKDLPLVDDERELLNDWVEILITHYKED